MRIERLVVVFLLLLSLLAGCRLEINGNQDAEAVLYRVDILGDYDPENPLEQEYPAGQTVALTLATITEHFYTVTVNGREIAMDFDASDFTYTVFSFTMPAEDVQILIEGHWVEIPTLAAETEPAETETVPGPEIKQPEPGDGDFVLVRNYIPDIIVDLRYGMENNFTGQRIYEFSDAWLRYGTVKKLMAVQEKLREMGLGLKIWDGFRPVSAQFRLWEVYPDPTYVANPNKGFSSHSRGNTVDVTLVNEDGEEVVMPTGFDDFSKLADRDYSDCNREAADNAMVLERIMSDHGFKPYSGEWWHFSDTQVYEVEKEFEPLAPLVYYADCEEFISLRMNPDTGAEAITTIPAGEELLVMAKSGRFALVRYRDLFGYVLLDFIQPIV